MILDHLDTDRSAVGDFDALLAQLDTTSPAAVVAEGYATLMARVNSAEYRQRCGLVRH